MNCPACQEPLDRDDRRPEWVCKNRHRTVRTVTVGRFNGRCPDRGDRHHETPLGQIDHNDPSVWWCGEGHYLVLDQPRTIQHLSPSSLATARDCMRRFEQAQVFGRREAPKWETEVGKFAHKVLEVVAEQPDGQRAFDEAKKLAAPAWLGYAAGWEYQSLQLPKEEEKRFKWEAVNAVEVSLAAHPLNGRTVLATEQRFDKLDLNGTPMTGQIDLTLLAEPDEEPDLDVLVVDHKGLALDTPLPAPTGWTTMGDVQVGDALFDAHGAPTKVIVKSEVHDRPCYAVRFDDGEEVVCDDEHLWNVGVCAQGSYYIDKTMNCAEIAAALAANRLVRVLNTEPLDTPEAALPVDPYVLGAWLGDGAHADVQAMVDELAKRGERRVSVVLDGPTYTITPAEPDPTRCYRGHGPDEWPGGTDRDHCLGCKADRTAPKWNSPLSGRLRALGVLNAKHVPAAYLRGSVSQRLELLRGLMDTDGHWHMSRRRAVFCNTNHALIAAVQEVVSSLGWRYSTAWTAGHAAAYVHFTPVDHNPFSLPRKADAVRLEGTVMAQRRMVTSVASVVRVPTQCIAVDSPTSTFLCGGRMVPTHNTGKFPSSSLATWQPGWPFKLGKHLELVAMVAKDQRKKLVQAHVYIAATKKLTGADRVGARLDFVKPGDDGVLWADPADTYEVMREVRQTWRAVQANQEAGQFPTETSGLCGWCPYLAWDNGDGTHDFCAAGVRYTRQRMSGPYGWTKFGTNDPDSVPAVVTIRGLSEDQRRIAYALADAVGPLEEAAA